MNFPACSHSPLTEQSELVAFLHTIKTAVLAQYLDVRFLYARACTQVLDGGELAVLAGRHDAFRRLDAHA